MAIFEETKFAGVPLHAAWIYTILSMHAGNGRDAAPQHCAVPWAVFPRRVSTSSAGDGATGQQPGPPVGNFSWPPPHPQAIAAD